MAALASYLHARARGGRWLLRIDDLDPERCKRHFARDIAAMLERLELHWDGPVMYQSARAAQYREALIELVRHGRLYFCSCSRLDIQKRSLPMGLDGSAVYDGLCRGQVMNSMDESQGRKLHFRLDGAFSCSDAVCGVFAGDHSRDTGDFAVTERSGRATYHLATVVDDHASAVTEVVRGADLLGCTPKQQALYAALDWTAPSYAHVPLVRAADGTKLSKQTGAGALMGDPARGEIWDALSVLGQQPPAELRGAAHSELLAWALPHWSLARVPVSSWTQRP